MAQIQDRFNLHGRATANNYVLKLAQSLIDMADENETTPEMIIEKVHQFLPNLLSSSGSPDTQLPDDSTSIVNHNHQLDSSSLLMNTMNTQQQSVEKLTTAIYDLIAVIKSERTTNNSSIATIYQQQERDVSNIQIEPTSVSSSEQDTATYTTSQIERPVSALERYSMEIRDRISRYIDLIMAFNDTPNRPYADKWAVSIAILRTLADCGSSPVYAVYESRKDEIETHNQKHNFTLLHNRKGKNSPSIKSVIHFD